MTRRQFVFASAAALVGVTTPRRLAAGTARRRLVLIHGRGQRGRSAAEIEREWLEALGRGAARVGRPLRVAVDVTVPFYGGVLEDFARRFDLPLTTDIVARGGAFDREFLEFQHEVAEAIRRAAGIGDDAVDQEYGPNPKERGPLNWEWVQAILRAIDKAVPGWAQRTLELFVRDVFLYVRRAGVRDEIDGIVRTAFDERPTVVVAHSLGSMVAYNVLRSDPRRLDVPLLVTIGSPLAIRAIRDEFRPLRHPGVVGTWRNAYDERDVVALYALDNNHFPVRPPIHNVSTVRNGSDDHHAAAGYLEDPTVAGWILDALAG